MGFLGISIGEGKDFYFKSDGAVRKYGSVDSLTDRLEALQKNLPAGLHSLALVVRGGSKRVMIRLTLDGSLTREQGAKFLVDQGIPVEDTSPHRDS